MKGMVKLKKVSSSNFKVEKVFTIHKLRVKMKRNKVRTALKYTMV